jgi:hypothetical protein
MFDNLVKQLELQSLGKNKSDFKINKREFEDFCKGFLFEEIKGDKKLGQHFCENYNETNHVLSILNNKAAREHIKMFYVA